MTDPKQQLQDTFREGRVLFVDKPFRWTSFDAVNKIKSQLRYRLGMKKVRIGHAGTLDPLATGLLIICTGRATKEITRYQDLDKTYTGTFVVGQVTPSFDLETQPVEESPFAHLRETDLLEAAAELTGELAQIPPLYSAKKIAGERAYHHARQGRQTALQARQVHVKTFEITGISLPEVSFRITCSKGTYIRAIARDFGEALGCGAYLGALRRTHIGIHSVEDAWQMDQLSEAIANAEL